MQTKFSSIRKAASLAALLALAPLALCAGDLHVATAGKDTNPGTAAAPFATIQQAEKSASPGDTVFIHGGTYKMTEKQIARFERNRGQVIDLGESGRPGKPICYFAVAGEKPVSDFSEVKPPNYRVTAFNVTGSLLRRYAVCSEAWITISSSPVASVQINSVSDSEK